MPVSWEQGKKIYLNRCLSCQAQGRALSRCSTQGVLPLGQEGCQTLGEGCREQQCSWLAPWPLGAPLYVPRPLGRGYISPALVFLTTPFCTLCSPERRVLAPFTDEQTEAHRRN